jgi:DNA-binding transcriptional ArsR family regulator
MIVHIHMNADVFNALADPTRRRIVEVLSTGEQPVNELVGHAGIHQSGVSRHLRILQDAGFVSVRPEGQWRVYALRPEPFKELDRWLSPYRRLWSARLDRFEASLAQRQRARRTTGKKEPRK